MIEVEPTYFVPSFFQKLEILQKLLDQPLRFEAFEDEMGRKGYRVTGQGSYLQLLPGPLAFTTAKNYSEAGRVPIVVSPIGT